MADQVVKMRQPTHSLRTYLVLSLLIPLALLATNCSNSDNTPSQDFSSDSKAIAITTGLEHSCALHQGGNISCWGNNKDGQLGNSTGDNKDDSLVPVEVLGITDATTITAGSYHSCALHQDGTISCWGANWAGQLGNDTGGNDEDRSLIPVEVLGISDATAITAGVANSCALHLGGTISCWGANWAGQLGNDTGGNDGERSLIPVQVLGIYNAIAITTGYAHSCALHQDGTISCWGHNNFGQLGNGTGGNDKERSLVPVQVLGIFDATTITTGRYHSCALHQDTTISCWGLNSSGQLGNGTENGSYVPVQVWSIYDATTITTSNDHSCALHQGGTISCWGDNFYGQLGNGTTIDSSVPVGVLGITDATTITTGRGHSCALHEDDNISCWGNNDDGQLGNGTGGNHGDRSLVPVQVLGITDATTITTGWEHSCALHGDGIISCWGDNEDGQLGNGTGGNEGKRSFVPVRVLDISNATAITAGREHSCALHQDTTISCWGHNSSGQLGNGTRTDSSVPVGVLGISDATTITTGWEHSCALHGDGIISCWGDNEDGQLGNGTGGNEGKRSFVPVRVLDISDATAITAGREHSCALHQDGTISCWGSNRSGQLGDGTDDSSLVPVQVPGITDTTAITAGNRHSCALHQDGTISCWGANWAGQLGNGTGGNEEDRSLVPMQVLGISDATAITTGVANSCALHEGGTISCWGANWAGQLGNGTGDGERSLVPAEVLGISDATAITTSRDHSCALHQDGTISCWGNDDDGQLGDGRDPRVPNLVVGFGS